MKLSNRARDRMEREAVDASQSGMVPLLGMGALAFIIGAIVRLIF